LGLGTFSVGGVAGRSRRIDREERREWLAGLETSEKAQAWDLPDLTRMMLATGCRIGECLAIVWPEVELAAATVDVRWRLVRRTGVGCGCRPPSRGRRESG
jgi:integrase